MILYILDEEKETVDMIKKTLITVLAFMVCTTVFAQSRRAEDRLRRCQDEKRNLEIQKNSEIQSLQYRLYSCQDRNSKPKVWSCQAGCIGLGNVGFGNGRTEAEAKRAALEDLGFTCSNHTFDCKPE